MSRVTRGTKARRRRKKILKQAKGYQGARSKLFRTATEAVDRALKYAYRDRRQRKREFRRLWIARINAAGRALGMKYGVLVHTLKQAGVGLDRKVLAEIAYHDPEGFAHVVEAARQRLAA